MMFAAAAVVGLAGSIGCKSAGLAAPATALGACFAFAFLELVSEAVAKPYLGFPIVAGGHAAVTCILFAMPKAPMLTTATKVIGGHILATIASIAQLALVYAATIARARDFSWTQPREIARLVHKPHSSPISSTSPFLVLAQAG